MLNEYNREIRVVFDNYFCKSIWDITKKIQFMLKGSADILYKGFSSAYLYLFKGVKQTPISRDTSVDCEGVVLCLNNFQITIVRRTCDLSMIVQSKLWQCLHKTSNANINTIDSSLLRCLQENFFPVDISI